MRRVASKQTPKQRAAAGGGKRKTEGKASRPAPPRSPSRAAKPAAPQRRPLPDEAPVASAAVPEPRAADSRGKYVYCIIRSDAPLRSRT